MLYVDELSPCNAGVEAPDVPLAAVVSSETVKGSSLVKRSIDLVPELTVSKFEAGSSMSSMIGLSERRPPPRRSLFEGRSFRRRER